MATLPKAPILELTAEELELAATVAARWPLGMDANAWLLDGTEDVRSVTGRILAATDEVINREG